MTFTIDLGGPLPTADGQVPDGRTVRAPAGRPRSLRIER